MAALWTDDEVATLRKLHAEGASVFTISVQIGRTVEAIKTKVLKLGLPNRRRYTVSGNPRVTISRGGVRKVYERHWPPELMAKVREAIASGTTRDELGALIGLRGDAVKQACIFNGIVDEYTAAMKSRMGANPGRPGGSGPEWSEQRNAKACAELRDLVLALYRRERAAA